MGARGIADGTLVVRITRYRTSGAAEFPEMPSIARSLRTRSAHTTRIAPSHSHQATHLERHRPIVGDEHAAPSPALKRTRETELLNRQTEREIGRRRGSHRSRAEIARRNIKRDLQPRRICLPSSSSSQQKKKTKNIKSRDPGRRQRKRGDAETQRSAKSPTSGSTVAVRPARRCPENVAPRPPPAHPPPVLPPPAQSPPGEPPHGGADLEN
jgi:hypothetical protein